MSEGFRRWNPWGKPTVPAAAVPAPPDDPVPPTPPRPKAAPEPVQLPAGDTLQVQVAEALRQRIANGDFTVHRLAVQAGLTDNTITRVLSGQGMKLATLETLAGVLGWTVTVAQSGVPIAISCLMPPAASPQSSAQPPE